MTDASTLGSQLYAKLAELIAPPGSLDGTGNVVLVEPCGRDLDPDDFGTDPDVAGAEAFAELVNVVPVPGATFVDSSRRLDDVTQMILLNASTDPAVSPAAAVLVGQARADLELMARGSATAGDDYHPATADPTHWWDTSEVWPTVSFSIGDATAPAQPPAHVVPLEPPPLVWTRCPDQGVVPDAVRVAASGRLSLRRLQREPDLREDLRKHLVQPVSVAEKVGPVNPVVVASRVLSAPSYATGTFATGTFAERGLLRHVRRFPEGNGDDGPTIVEPVVRPRFYRDLLDAHQVLVDAAPTAPVQPSSGFELSFSYRVVSIRRPWWHPELFVQPGWTMRGFAPGSVSTGTPTQNPGLLGAVTTRMLLVRDLTVRGTWSSADANAASAAQEQFGTLGLGPFSLTGDVGWDHSSLTRPGVQAVAWLAALTPFFPPAA